MTIKLTDAAKYYKELPHQLAAWNWLQERNRYQDVPDSLYQLVYNFKIQDILV